MDVIKSARCRLAASPSPAPMRACALILLACLCAVSSGCAHMPNRTPPRAEAPPPQLDLTQALATSELCLRGRLPEPGALSVGALGELWVGAEARAECEAQRADAVVGAAQAFNRAWAAYWSGNQ